MKKSVTGRPVSVLYDIGSVVPNMACVSVVGKEITFPLIEFFFEAKDLASNVECYALENGCVKLDLTFHGLMREG